PGRRRHPLEDRGHQGRRDDHGRGAPPGVPGRPLRGRQRLRRPADRVAGGSHRGARPGAGGRDQGVRPGRLAAGRDGQPQPGGQEGGADPRPVGGGMAEAGRRRWRARRRALGRSDLAAAKLSWRAASGRVLVRTILSWAAVWLVPGCDHGTTTTPTASPTPTAPAAPTPSPTLPPAPTAPVSLDVKLNPNPASGPAPLDLHVSLCGSRPVPPVDGYPLTFTL